MFIHFIGSERATCDSVRIIPEHEDLLLNTGTTERDLFFPWITFHKFVPSNVHVNKSQIFSSIDYEIFANNVLR